MRWMYLELAGAAALAIWLYLLLGRGQFWRMREAPMPGPLPGGAPSVVAVIPARNEAQVVGRTVASLAQQKYPGEFHIVLSDDASDDGTAQAAREAAHEAGRAERLTVIRAGRLPDGWTGKMWAVAEGVQAADRLHPEYLLLTDADIVHAPDNLAGLVARAQSDGSDLVSYMVKLECRTLAEQALIPAFVFFFFMLYPPSHGTGAAGGCILIRRDALERVGGVWRIRGELIDDCALARAVRQSGGRVWMGLSAATCSIRGYDAGYAGFGQIGRMISRTAFAQLRHSAPLLAGTVLALAVTYLAPPLLTLLGPRGAASGMGAMAWLLMSVAYYPALRFYGRPWFWAPLLPAVALFYLGATIHSAAAYRSGTGGLWKGRVQDAAGR
jgi:hopene-associated glycosyltransferase HpnB